MSSPTAGKTRSPNYPSISLEDAIERLRGIYEKQQRYPATREVLAQLMGYSGLNGASASVVSALSKYGLIEGHGETLRVSEMGQDLILHRRGDPEYDAAVRASAYMPAFFRELREQFPSGLPHDHSLRATLVKRGFNPRAIDAAVRTYRETIDFVSKETGTQTEKVSDELEVSRSTRREASQPGQVAHIPMDGGQRSVSLPLSVSEWATLQAPFPLSESAWNQMIAVLQAMKPALVAPEKQAGVLEDASSVHELEE
jgi:hypothetical protein